MSFQRLEEGRNLCSPAAAGSRKVKSDLESARSDRNPSLSTGAGITRGSLCRAHPAILVRCLNELLERRRIDLAPGLQLHVPHVLARSFQQARWIRERGTIEEANVDVALEYVDVRERHVGDTSDG